MLDVNGTKHHLLLGEADWRVATESSPQVEWSARAQALRLKAKLFRFPKPPADQPPRLSNRRGVANDRLGNWYWVDETRQAIRFTSAQLSASGESRHFWRSADWRPPAQTRGDFNDAAPAAAPPTYLFGGLAVTTLHYLVVGVISPAALLIFDLHAGGAPLQLDWPSELEFSPFELASLPDGGVVILDRALTEEDFQFARLWFLDCHFQLTAPLGGSLEMAPARIFDFQPAAGEPETRPATSFPRGVLLQKSQSPPAPIYASAVEVLPDRTILILENDPDQISSKVYRFRGETLLGAPIALSEEIALRGHDFAFVAEETAAEKFAGTLFVVDAEGNQAFSYHLQAAGESWSLQLNTQYFPMRLFSGKGVVAATAGRFATGDRAYYDAEGRWLPLAEQARPRFEDEATFELSVFDGKTPQCLWHRLFIDACVPPGTEVIVESRAADLPDLLPHVPYRREPRLYLRPIGGTALFASRRGEKRRQEKGEGTWELLLQNCQGRFQQLRLTLRGNGRVTPMLRALRSFYPRFSYLKEYLPAVYREDKSSAAFLDRFLSNVEGFFTIWEGAIANAQILFDTRTIPADYLEWLAAWFGLTLDPSWDEARRRLLLRYAITLFNQRGTSRGILNAITLATDPCPEETLVVEAASRSSDVPVRSKFLRPGRFGPRLVERFLLRRAPGVVFGDPRQATGPGVTTEILKWTPADGAEILHRRYRQFLQQRYAASEESGLLNKLKEAWGKTFATPAQIVLPGVRPPNNPEQTDWCDFLREGLGFTYAEVGSEDVEVYRTFLARRYRRPEVLTAAYQLKLPVISFSQIELPDVLPATGKRLFDWIQFVSVHLPTLRAAHRFTVLLPTLPGESIEAQQQRAGLVRRLVELEKPAHTSFEVAFYFALLRAGEARLGLDTVLDQGSRFVALQLGRSQLASARLAPSAPPWNVQERLVANRDRLQAPARL